MAFIHSLELSRMLYEEEIRPTIERRFPDLNYAAATLGMCSEVLGLDDEVSTDHEWGPRVTLFLSEEDHVRHATDLMAILKQSLPTRFKELDVMWRKPGVDIHDTSETALYHVWTSRVADALRFCGGSTALQPLDWIKVSEQHLLEFTSGVVYHDDTGELTKARETLAYYPDDVLRFLLMCDWNSVGGEWFPLGRIGSRGDQLGVHIQAVKAARHLMRIAFRVSRQYFTYKKWFGMLFKRLPIAAALEPVLLELVREDDWERVEELIRDAALILLEAQNAMGIAPKIALGAKQVDDGRHHIDMDFWKIGQRTGQRIPPQLKTLQDNEVFWLDERQLILWNEEVGKWTMFLQKQ
jgi:hypothetical protein